LAEVFEKMQPAVLHALHKARDNKVDVLFSPGCASFDEFKNFEERGEIFNQLVRLEFKDFV
jgi:UDP-N-acetylmuramoylalanine--D-glutamate ligase